SYAHPEDALLLGRIACAGGRPGADEQLRWIDEHCDLAAAPAATRTLASLVRLATNAVATRSIDEAAWEALAREAAETSSFDEQMELATTAAGVFRTCGR